MIIALAERPMIAHRVTTKDMAWGAIDLGCDLATEVIDRGSKLKWQGRVGTSWNETNSVNCVTDDRCWGNCLVVSEAGEANSGDPNDSSGGGPIAGRGTISR